MTAPPRGGVVVVDKPSGWTSHDVVGRVRRLAGTRKVGHAGTLDPMATGVLVLGIERATRLLGHLQLADKEYLATVRLGAATTTDDAEGEVTSTTDASHLTAEQVEAALVPLRGEIDQVPSSVSAIKVDGQRSYARVRAGEQVELKARRVTVAELVAEQVRVDHGFVDVDVRVTCSSGTYVRALARDVGDALGVGGHLTVLRRTRVGAFGLGVAATLDQLAVQFSVVPLDEVARATFDAVDLDEEAARHVGFGRALPDTTLPSAGPVALFAPDGRFLALYEQAGDDARPVAVFV
ncbi:tRNA pseudouridine synthase B [Aeromicrobium marinum DSM 15272]|uniref:tRNA pseudouridine synthase B n=1 Tax=Aeromicrobium marinum DSM 15272 TaxID=585531 RepID=E2SED9_9ACTN|nr:tRNA pseudouridine(55) synthase TruB [Aeromicrobium marinum]EFQ82416.1 tRNA pseudouridine synthase B [Aeromicrobium marinum DSM 15272]